MSNGLVSASLARGLARNPLGVIALFLFLIYGLATLAFSVNTLTPQERWPLVWFLVLFPLIVLATFAWLVSSHHEKLSAPSDYRDDEGFHRSTVARHQYLKELERQNVHLKARVGEAVREQFEKDGPRLEGAMQGISEAIDRGTSIYVDMTAVSGTDVMSVSFPIAAFETFGDLTDAVYYELEDIVGAFEYGHSCDDSSGPSDNRVLSHALRKKALCGLHREREQPVGSSSKQLCIRNARAGADSLRPAVAGH